jgi:soluble lytic murein transglycosylase-like protein/TolA-binding protein
LRRWPVVLGLFCLSFGARAADQGSALVELMQYLRDQVAQSLEKRLSGLYDSFSNASDAQNRKLLSLSLGVHNLDGNARLALQYLSSAELSCKDDDPALPIVRFYKAQAQLKLGAYNEAAAIAQELLKKELGDAWDKQIYSVLIESLHETGDGDALVGVFQAYAHRFAMSRRQESLARLAAEAFEAKGQTDKAIEILEEIARGYPTSDTSRWAWQKLEDYTCPKNAKPYFFNRDLLYAVARNAALGTGLEQILEANAYRPLKIAPNTVRELTPGERADYFFQTRLYPQALAEVENQYAIEKNRPDSKSLPGLVLELGRIHMRMHQSEEAGYRFADFLEKFPTHPYAPRAHEYLGDSLRYLGVPLAAADQYSQAMGRTESKILRWQQFWSTYRGKNYAAALELMKKVSPRDGDDEQMLNYWRARIMDKMGKHDDAKSLFKTVLNNDADGFYGNMVAAQHPEWTGEAPPRPSVAETAKERVSLAAKILTGSRGVASTPEMKLVDDLLAVGMKDAATIQLSNLKWDRYGQDEAFAAVSRLAWVLDNYQASRKIKFAPASPLRLVPKAWRDYVTHQSPHADEWKVYFPLAFADTIDSVSQRVGIDRFFLLSIMRAESFYNKDARSPVGATGLMQLMPYTAIKLAALVRDEDFEILDLGEPEVNIGYGGFYLNKLLGYYGGNPYLAAAAYNGGPLNVNHWLESCKGCDTDEFVESIPFRETRRYVRQVITNMAQYMRIYGGKQTLAMLPKLPDALPEEEIF